MGTKNTKENKESPSAMLFYLFKHPPAEARQVTGIVKVGSGVNVGFSL